MKRQTITLTVACCALLAAFFAPGASALGNRDFVIVNPSNNQTLKGAFTVRAAVKKSLVKSVAGVEFMIDGRVLHKDRKAPYTWRTDAKFITSGQHVLTANITMRKRSKKAPKRQICQYTRSIYINVQSSIASVAAIRKPPVPVPLASQKKKWKLLFNDEFSSPWLNTTKWSSQRDDWFIGGNPYNDRENAWYGAENVSTAGGKLIQKITNVPQGGYPLTTGMVNTNKKFSFRYGYLEARVKVPGCIGCWPVFWSLPQGGTGPPELDFFEFMHANGQIQAKPFFASHWSENGVPQSNLDYFTQPCGTALSYTGNYHTYGFMWTPTKVQAYLDGIPGPSFTGPAVPHESMYLILSLAVLDGMIPTGSPQMATDFIRVWQQK